MLIAYYATGVSRRQLQNCTQKIKNINTFEFHYHIWNHKNNSNKYNKYNLFINSYIDVTISEMRENEITLAQ